MSILRLFFAFFLVLTSSHTASFADHSPEKMIRNMKAFSKAGITGKYGPFKINMAVFGKLPDSEFSSQPYEKYDKVLGDKFNLASIVLKDGVTVFERYNTKHNVNSNTAFLGMSMSKTAVAASIGVLLCEHKINSLEDEAGAYSSFLASTPYATVKIRNILQMSSGVSPLGRSDVKKFAHKARGLKRFSGQGDVRQALNFYKSAARKQGRGMNYHASDTLALSVLAEDIAGVPLSKIFFQKVYLKFGKSNYLHWTSDKSGTTVGFSDLAMTARDWAEFGHYLMAQKIAKTCLGKFFNEGVNKSVRTGKENGSRYGYQSWVFDVNGKPSLVLQGHGGQFVVLNESSNTVLLTISSSPQYKAGNLFSNIHKIAERISR